MNANKLSNYAGCCNVPLPFAPGGKVAPADRAGFEPRNRLLAALPREVLSKLLPHLKPEFLPRRKVLCDLLPCAVRGIVDPVRDGDS